MLDEQRIPDSIRVTSFNNIEVRETTVITRDGVRDESFAPKYHRYVLHPGDDLTGKDQRIVAVAQSVWSPDVVTAYQAHQASEEKEAS